jgi:uncharacterized protein (DUF1778 family)
MSDIAENRRPRDQAITFRASYSQRLLIDQAARFLGKTRSEFVLETICREAEVVLRDRVLFHLGDEPYAQFDAMLDAPPVPSDALQRLLRDSTPWE